MNSVTYFRLKIFSSILCIVFLFSTFIHVRNVYAEEDRILPLKGIANARDLGGYITKSGRITKWNVLYRSDTLGNATSSDKQYIKDLGIKTIIDLRTSAEISQRPDASITGIESIRINLWGDDYTKNLSSSISMKTVEQTEDYYKSLYKYFVNGDIPHAKAKEFFSFIENNDAPILWHCTSGKDRTGLLAALLLYALDVPEETIMQEYLLTNQQIRDFYPSFSKEFEDELFVAKTGVRPSYLSAAFEEMKNKYGSIETYLSDVCGVNQQIKTKLIEKYTTSDLAQTSDNSKLYAGIYLLFSFVFIIFLVFIGKNKSKT